MGGEKPFDRDQLYYSNHLLYIIQTEELHVQLWSVQLERVHGSAAGLKLTHDTAEE